jgi:hypothetical protein
MTKARQKIDPAIQRYMSCRLVGHTWRIVADDDHDYEPMYGLWSLVLRCSNCEAERRDAFNIHGDVMSRQYIHPHDYKSAERVYRPEVRRMWITSKNKERRLKVVREKLG